MSQIQFTDLFQKIEILGKGQFEVWKYIRIYDNQPVAVKIIHTKFLKDKQK